MTEITETFHTLQGYQLHLIPTKKFKTIHIVIKFKSELQRDAITKRALLPYLLQQGTTQYPTERLLQTKLDQLYGASLSIDGAKKGEHHILCFRMEIANDRYISKENSLIEEGLLFLKQMLFEPLFLEQDKFPIHIFEREKESLRQRIKSVIDDKITYANMRLIDHMCEHEKYAIHVSGYEEDLDVLTIDDLREYYQSVIQEDEIDLYILGDFSKNNMYKKIKNIFSGTLDDKLTTKTKLVKEKKDRGKLTETQEIIETQDIQQAKLHIGYRTNTTFKDDDYFALTVFNGLFGSLPSSKLFINVREKNSLAYYVASRVESHKGLLIVFSGIAGSDYKKAREIIQLQFDEMKEGKFSKSDVEKTKELIINQLLETLDHPQGIIELLYQQVVGKKELPPTELFNGIQQVTKKDIINIAHKIKKDTIYLLTSEEDEDHE